MNARIITLIPLLVATASATGAIAGGTTTNEGDLIVSDVMTLNDQVGTLQTGTTGMSGDDAADSIGNTGKVQVTTGATFDNIDFTLELVDTGNAGTQALTEANGIAAAKGNDAVTSTGEITVEAGAAVNSTTFGVSLIGAADDIDAGNLARSKAVGADGGAGNDQISVSGSTTVTGEASVDANGITLDVLHVESLRAPVGADATATGISGGSGNDTISAAGTLAVAAEANADSLDIQISAVEVSTGETKRWSIANARGIDSGTGTDGVLNASLMTVRGVATTTTTGINVSLLDLSLLSDLLNPDASADSSTSSKAIVTGITGGSGNKSIDNQGDMTVTAGAETSTFDLSWSAYGISNPADIADYIDYFKEAPVIDAGTTSEATAVGISTGTGNDVITNSATLTSRATAEVSAGSVGVDFPVPDIIPISLPSIDTTEVAASSTAHSTGIESGEGSDTISGPGAIAAEATATASSWSVSVSLQPSLGEDDEASGGASEWFPSLSGNLVDVGARAEAGATGIQTAGGADHLQSTGSVSATATADAAATDVEVTLEQADDKLSAGLALANASTEATATATGVDTGSDSDDIATSGAVHAGTLAKTVSTTVAVDVTLLEDTKVALGGIVTSANTDAAASSTGISAGTGNDVIRVTESEPAAAMALQASDSVSAEARADADAIGVIVDVAASTGKDFSIVGEGAWARADTLATADAEGVTGGDGADSIRNESSIAADTQADSLSVGVAVTAAGTKKGVSLGLALAQANSEAEAASTGIGGGAGGDDIVNSGQVNSKARSDVESVGVSVGLSLTDKGVPLTGTAADASTIGTATATGITGDAGTDTITNDKDVHASAEVDATSVSVSVSAQGASKGVALGVALSKATSEAETDSSGIAGGADSDTIGNAGLVKSTATATLVAGSGGLAAGGAGKGIALEGAAADGSTTGTAGAGGISGDGGSDLIENTGTVDVLAKADTTTVSVAVSANGSGTGLALGVGLARATSEGHAVGSGISGGEQNDTISNSMVVNSQAVATVVAGSGALAAGGTGKGLTLEGAAVDGSTTATADTVGIGGDQGNDIIRNDADGTVDVSATAETTTVSVAASANGTGTGAALGVALGRATSTAQANAAGISGGVGNDAITSSGLVKSSAQSDVSAVGVTASLGGAGTGVALEGTAADASTTGTANALGISGEQGADNILNEGTMEVGSVADVASTSVSVSASGAGTGAGLGAALTRAETCAVATSTGISLGGSGDIPSAVAADHGENRGQITSNATATAESTSVGVQLGITGTGLQGGVSMADASTTATADAFGMAGGGQGDEISNTGTIAATANADSDSTSVSVGLNVSLEGASLGATIVDATTDAVAAGSGIAGGAGNDLIDNRGAVTSTALSAAGGVSVSVSVGVSFVPLNASVADMTTTSIGTAAGIDAGAGNDTITDSGTILSTAGSDANGTTVSVSPIGASMGSSDVSSRVAAVGVDGGTGDDTVQLNGKTTANATSTATGTVVNVVLTGASGNLLDSSDTLAEATATGVSAGAGHNLINTAGPLTATSNAGVEGTSVTVGVTGAAIGAMNSTARATAAGIQGGAGIDGITNADAITSKATATTSPTNVGVTLVGASLGDNTTTAEAAATGIAGGAGDDGIENGAGISVTSTAATTAQGVSVTLFGDAEGDADVTADGTSTGIAGNEGADHILNHGTITATATASASVVGDTWNVVGNASGDSILKPEAMAVGIDGGTGGDRIDNDGNIVLKATTSTQSTTRNITILAGAAGGDAGVVASSGAAGLSGNDGDDLMDNRGTISGSATATVTASSTTYTTAGAALGNSAQTTGDAFITGIAGGAGSDNIRNAGAIDIAASATTSADSTSISIFGSSSAGDGLSARGRATGLDGGEGNDVMENLATIDVASHGTMTMSGSSYTFGGTGSTGGTLAATTGASGISGGDGTDRIANKGNVTIVATSRLDSLGESEATFGTSAGTTTSGAFTVASGIDGGDGDDSIEHGAGRTIDVHATTTVNSTKSSYTFGGTATSDTALRGVSTAGGISGGWGANSVHMDGDVMVTATSTIAASGGTKTTFGGTTGSGSAAAEAIATGAAGGEKADTLVNAGILTVTAVSNGTALNSSDAGWLVGDGDTISTARTTGTGYGLSAGEGNNEITNDGDILVSATGRGYAFSYASGAHISWDGDGEAMADSRAGAMALGVVAGSGDNRIENNGKLRVSAAASSAWDLTTSIKVCSQEVVTEQVCHDEPDPEDDDKTIQVCVDEKKTITSCVDQPLVLASLPTYAGANGNGVTGTGRATALGTTDAEAYGIKVGDGNNLIVNNQEITVTASPDARTTVFADGDAFGDAIGTTAATARAKAFGIWAGNGNNEIANNSTLSVTAAPRAQARTEVSGGDICIWYLFGTWCGGGGDGIGTATATFDAQATGVLTGNGDNLITNNGTLTVTARPDAAAFTAGVFSANVAAIATSVTSKAVGIQTGDGNNRVVNTEDGLIDVKAFDLSIAYGCTHGPCARSFSAVGIQTGSGDDLVVNNGTITTSLPSGHGIGITTGAGNDTIMLGNGSSVTGAIDLGDGDDTLHLFGSPLVNGAINSGTGSNSLILEGDGTFANTLPGFANTTKQGGGTYSIPALSAMQRLEVKEGVLHVNSDYQFAGDGTFLTTVNGNGSSGRLRISGMAHLDGTMSVAKGPGHYHNGTTYDVVEADGTTLDGTFSTVTLPAPTPLLSFETHQLPSTVQIEALAQKFTTVATDTTQQAVADYLDHIMPFATGDLANILGEIQGLPASEFKKAFSSLSPDSYTGATAASGQTTTQYLRTLGARMQGIRAHGMSSGSTLRSDIQTDRTVLLAYNGSDASIAELFDIERRDKAPERYGLWIDGFGRWGDQGADPGFTGFNYSVAGGALGLDFLLEERVIVGASGGYSYTSIDLDDNKGDGNTRSSFGSIYGSYFTGKFYLETSLSYARQNYRNRRNIAVGAIQSQAGSKHNGNAYSASLAGGYNFAFERWLLQPLASLRYTYLEEDGFRESGAGGVNLIVGDRSTESLESELGLRLARIFPTGIGTFIPEVRVAWNYDFDLDDRVITAAFEGSPNTTFAITGQEVEKHGAIIGAGITLVQKNGFSTTLKYDTELREDYSSHGLFGEIRYSF